MPRREREEKERIPGHLFVDWEISGARVPERILSFVSRRERIAKTIRHGENK